MTNEEKLKAFADGVGHPSRDQALADLKLLLRYEMAENKTEMNQAEQERVSRLVGGTFGDERAAIMLRLLEIATQKSKKRGRGK